MRFLLIFMIRCYQRYLRRLIKRRCIYEHSCSNYAIARLQDPTLTTWSALTAIRARIKGCGITSVTLFAETAQCQVVNNNGQRVPLDRLAPCVINALEKRSTSEINDQVPI